MGLPTLVLLASTLAGAAEPVEAVRENIRTSLEALEKAVPPVEDLTASYAADGPTAGPAVREALRGAVNSEVTRLNKSLGEFWPLWDVARFAEGARLLGGAVRGTETVEAGSSFLDETDIEDFKADVRRMQDRARRALEREEAAFRAFQARSESRRRDLLLSGLAGAVAAGALAGGAYLRSRRENRL